MNKTFIAKMKTRLTKEKDAFEKQIAELSGKRGPREATARVEWMDLGTKDDENAAEVATYQDNLSLEKKLQQSLDDVAGALQRIVDGTYGVCAKCGKDIDEKRLDVFPAATQHTEC